MYCHKPPTLFKIELPAFCWIILVITAERQCFHLGEQITRRAKIIIKRKLWGAESTASAQLVRANWKL